MSTKKLARELGLIRRSSQSSHKHQQSASRQIFSYLIIIDFESTCWKEKNNYGQEIIEFPAVLLNTSNGEIESEFHSYLQPQEHPVLSSFCTELTGITQEQVEAGLPLPICLSRFMRWIHTLQQEKGVVITDTHTATAASAKPCTFITWSDWDLGVCLQYECKRKQITKPEILNSWIDLRATYRVFYNRKPKGLNGALQDLGIEFSGREHCGLDDARNTARLAWRMITDGCMMKITKSLSRTMMRSRPPAAGVCERPGTSTHTRTSTHTGMSTHSSMCQSLVSPRTTLTSLTAPLFVTLPTLPVTTLTHLSSDWSEEYPVTEADSGSYDDVVLEDTQPRPHASDLTVTDPYRSLTRPGIYSTTTPSIPFSIYKDQSENNQSAPSSISANQSALSSFVTKPSPHLSIFNQSASRSSSIAQSSRSFSYGNKSALSSLSVNQSTLSFRSVNQPTKRPSLLAPRGGAKITSPLCDCGRRSKRLTVCNGGPNQGRAFYTCAVRKSSGPAPLNPAAPRGKGCGFFKWESALIKASSVIGRSFNLNPAASRSFR